MNAKAIVPRREAASISVLIAGGIAYALLCLPAIGQRGYPPLHPFWWAMTFMWVFPLLGSCWFDSWSFQQRRRHLWYYALATAFVNSGTPVVMVPKSVNVLGMLLATIFFFGPIHALVGFGLEALAQSFLGRWRILAQVGPHEGRRFHFSLLALLYFQTVLTLTLAFPLTFCRVVEADKQCRARHKAESDWKNGEPILYGDQEYVNASGGLVTYEVDRQTGLPLKHPFLTATFTTAYNNRIRHLLRENPSKTLLSPSRIPTPDAVASLLSSNELQEVIAFPHRVAPTLSLNRASNGWLCLDTSAGRLMIGDSQKSIYAGELPCHDEFIAVRAGSKWVGVYTPDGCLVATASQ
jgi:hypothetical protein